jgi:ABC-type dipeptide/oligopeptide/nickel transport system permease subunit
MPVETRRIGGFGTATRTGAVALAVLTTVAIVAPLVAPHDPFDVRTGRILEGPSWEFPAGTDHLGRCVFSRTLHGASWSLGGALLLTTVVVAGGTAVGLVAGVGGAWADTVLMRAAEVVLSFPPMLLALAAIGLLGPGFVQALAAFAVVWWARYARLVRALTVSARESDPVLASRAAGGGWLHAVRWHIGPEVARALVVVAAIDFGETLLVLSAVSYLGLGVPPPTPEWGAMVSDARAYMLTAPRLTLVPGLAIALTVMLANLLSDAARDAAI